MKKILPIVGGILLVLCIVGAAFAGSLYGSLFGRSQTLPVPVTAVVTMVPANTKSVTAIPTFMPTVTPMPTVTSTSTATALPSLVPIDCNDVNTIDYIRDNNETLANFASINKSGLSHFNKNGKLDKTGYGDVYLKVEKIESKLANLTPPSQLLLFRSYQLKYLDSLKWAFKYAQKGDSSEAWSNLSQAEYYQQLMDHQAYSYWTCELPLLPSK